MLKTTKKNWMEGVAESVQSSDLLTLKTDPELVTDTSSLLVESRFFDVDYITGTLSREHRSRLDISLRENRSTDGAYEFQLRPCSKTFRPNIVGQEIIEKVLEDPSFGELSGVIDYTISEKGVEILTDELSEPRLFLNLSSSAWKLYTTSRTPDGNYKFIFRQMGSDKDTIISRLSRNRKQRIIWDTRLNCVNCSDRNSIKYAPTDGSAEFCFQCDTCGSEWGYTGHPTDRIKQNQTRGFIKMKVKQAYQTAVGTPNN